MESCGDDVRSKEAWHRKVKSAVFAGQCMASACKSAAGTMHRKQWVTGGQSFRVAQRRKVGRWPSPLGRRFRVGTASVGEAFCLLTI